MALQLSLRRGALMGMRTNARLGHHPLAAVASSARSFAADAGDVIGIDLGTTNSCVAVMVGDPGLQLD